MSQENKSKYVLTLTYIQVKCYRCELFVSRMPAQLRMTMRCKRRRNQDVTWKEPSILSVTSSYRRLSHTIQLYRATQCISRLISLCFGKYNNSKLVAFFIYEWLCCQTTICILFPGRVFMYTSKSAIRHIYIVTIIHSFTELHANIQANFSSVNTYQFKIRNKLPVWELWSHSITVYSYIVFTRNSTVSQTMFTFLNLLGQYDKKYRVSDNVRLLSSYWHCEWHIHMHLIYLYCCTWLCHQLISQFYLNKVRMFNL